MRQSVHRPSRSHLTLRRLQASQAVRIGVRTFAWCVWVGMHGGGESSIGKSDRKWAAFYIARLPIHWSASSVYSQA